MLCADLDLCGGVRAAAGRLPGVARCQRSVGDDGATHARRVRPARHALLPGTAEARRRAVAIHPHHVRNDPGQLPVWSFDADVEVVTNALTGKAYDWQPASDAAMAAATDADARAEQQQHAEVI